MSINRRLRTYTPGEDAPITFDWLRSIGGKIGTAPAGNKYADIEIDSGGDEYGSAWTTWLRVHEPNGDGEWPVELWSANEDATPDGIGLTKFWPSKRGDILLILAALGVEPKQYRPASFLPLMDDAWEWSQDTFGSLQSRGPTGPIKQLKAECDELLQAPDDITEYADAMLLLCDAFRRAGFTPQEILDATAAKLEVNKQRTWPKPTSDEPVMHTKEAA